MTIYNVLVPVVKLISAKSSDEAISKVTDALREAGFDPFTEPGSGTNAFISEDQDGEVDVDGYSECCGCPSRVFAGHDQRQHYLPSLP